MKQEAKIEYPCEWQFVLIGRTQAAIEVAVQNVMEAQQYQLNPKKHSKKGTYISMQLNCIVY
ncbi:MAG TPA: DUF493 domain-containing protein, partial [Candidatus Marinimicrobia bacterium]|nr:DUF493 domain-containing protein [Candidatus Neomarinimicrobiota bacterium]